MLKDEPELEAEWNDVVGVLADHCKHPTFYLAPSTGASCQLQRRHIAFWAHVLVGAP